jgi:hypothetical protein
MPYKNATRNAWRARNRDRLNRQARAAYRAKMDARGSSPRVLATQAFADRVASLSVAQRAYLAGLIDGEGCIHIARVDGPRHKSPWVRCVIKVCMTTREPGETVAEWLGLSLREHARPAPKTPVFEWAVTGLRAAAVAEAVFPYLLLKQRHAELVLELEKTRPRLGPKQLSAEVIARQAEIWTEFSDLNSLKGGSRRRRGVA